WAVVSRRVLSGRVWVWTLLPAWLLVCRSRRVRWTRICGWQPRLHWRWLTWLCRRRSARVLRWRGSRRLLGRRSWWILRRRAFLRRRRPWWRRPTVSETGTNDVLNAHPFGDGHFPVRYTDLNGTEVRRAEK